MALRAALASHRAGDLAAAEAEYRRALRAERNNATAMHLLGVLLHQTGRHVEGLKLLRDAVSLCPDSAEFRNSLGGALGRLGHYEEAVKSLREAVRLREDYAEAHNNLGLALAGLGDVEGAIEALHAATRLRPGYAEAIGNLGDVLRKAGQIDEAIQAYRRAAALRPSSAKAWWPLVKALEQRGQTEEVIAGFRTIVELEPQSASAHSALLYTLHYHPHYDRGKLFEEHKEWARRHGSSRHAPRAVADGTRSVPATRLRVGYVSPDFRDHTVPRFIEGALTHHDRERFEVFCYSDVARPDAVTARLRGLPLQWREIAGMPDGQVEHLVRADGIDILVDLRGHAAGNRLKLFARKPAPVQVTMVGYFDTTGLPEMDWRVTDAIQDPPGESDRYHSEKLARLARSCWCYRPDDDAPAVGLPPALSNGFVSFGSLNKILKISPPCARLWGRVLREVPNSRLLLSIAGKDEHNTVRDMLARQGVPADRICLLSKTRGRGEYLERFNQIDVSLDTFPFNGITTTCDSLWMGVPVVNLAGETSVSRTGMSILRAAGLTELAGQSEEEFVRAAVELANDVDRRRRLRVDLRDKLGASALLDARGYTSNLELTYLRMWRVIPRGSPFPRAAR